MKIYFKWVQLSERHLNMVLIRFFSHSCIVQFLKPDKVIYFKSASNFNICSPITGQKMEFIKVFHRVFSYLLGIFTSLYSNGYYSKNCVQLIVASNFDYGTDKNNNNNQEKQKWNGAK